MGNQSVSFYAVGDIRPDRPNLDEIFDASRSMLKEADITFGQLECDIGVGGVLQPHLSGTLPQADPSMAETLKNAGFKVMSVAGNHSMDYSNFLDTLDWLKKNGITGYGMGKDMEEARKPVIIDIKGNRIGLLARNAVGNLPGFHAGAIKPGTAPIKIKTSYEVFDPQPGIPLMIHTKPNEQDLEETLEDIKKLRPQVDVLIWSCHWGLHQIPKVLADYELEVGHKVIDAGADIILGHHPHLIKGIEIYKGKPIFYSLGNFAFDIYAKVPRAYLEEHGSDNLPDKIPGARAEKYLIGFDSRKFDPDYPRAQWGVVARKTMIVKVIIADKKIQKITIVPAMTNKVLCQPEPLSAQSAKGREVINFLEESSDQFHTKLPIEGDEAVVFES